MALPEDFDLRLARIRDTRQSNCRGTALYLAGLQRTDRFRSETGTYKHFLKKMVRKRTPIEGGLVAWLYLPPENPPRMIIAHLGIITQLPMRITHREKTGGPIIKNQTFEEVNDYYKFPRIGTRCQDEDMAWREIAFYDPSTWKQLRD